MRITPLRLAILKAINRYGVLPSNFIYALNDGNPDWCKRNLQKLHERGYVYMPEQQDDNKLGMWANHIYALTEKGADALFDDGIDYIPWANRQFWHQLMTAEIVASFEIICNERGLKYRSREEILGKKSLSLPATIYLDDEPWGEFLTPDAIFGIEDLIFVVEADRDQEPFWREHFRLSSYRRKITQYADVFKNRTYQREWGIRSLFVLNVTTSRTHCLNILQGMEDRMGARPRALLFKAIHSFGSKAAIPKPVLTLLDDPWERNGHDPLVIAKELPNGPETVSHSRADQYQRGNRPGA